MAAVADQKGVQQVIFLGKAGSGKGTQAKRVAERFGIPHISTGDILREAVKNETELGRRAAPIMAAGELVPDDLMIGIIRERLQQPDAAAGFILDGFPRTVAQAEKLDEMLAGNGNESLKVLHLSVPDEMIIRRIVARRSCSSCGAIYHLENSPPAKEGVCDRCGGALIARADDREEVVRPRLESFQRQTMPVVEHYRRKNLLQEIDGQLSADKVFEEIEKSLN